MSDGPSTRFGARRPPSKGLVLGPLTCGRSPRHCLTSPPSQKMPTLFQRLPRPLPFLRDVTVSAFSMALECVGRCLVELRPSMGADPRCPLTASLVPPPSGCGARGGGPTAEPGTQVPPSGAHGLVGEKGMETNPNSGFRLPFSLIPRCWGWLEGQVAFHHLPGRASSRGPARDGGRAQGREVGIPAPAAAGSLVSGVTMPTRGADLGGQDCLLIPAAMLGPWGRWVGAAA